jgi:hypothetical protein
MRNIHNMLFPLGIMLLLTVVICRADESISIFAKPQSAPSSKSKYQLIPPWEDLTPGNAAAVYYRGFCIFLEGQKLLPFFHGELRKDEQGNENTQRALWLKTPLKDLPQIEVENHLRLFSFLLKESRLAARKRDCDWEIQDRVTWTSLLPEVQSFRPLAELILLQARLAMAKGNLDAALDSLQTNMAIARHLSRGPTIIHTLVGAAIARLTLEQVNDLVQMPDAPNLYWALTALPAPFISMDFALQEEKNYIERIFPMVKVLKQGPASHATMTAMEKEIEGFKSSLGIRGGMDTQMLAQGVGSDAKKNLIAAGYAPEAVEKMPKLQLAILDSLQRFERARDELMMLHLLPIHQAEPQYQKALPAYKEACSRLDAFLFHGVLQAFQITDGYFKTWQAHVRVDQRIALLRCIEAIRMHAAEHAGQAPESLGAVKIVPIPLDPMTGLPFIYALKGKEITLQTPASKGEEKAKAYLTYQLQLK